MSKLTIAVWRATEIDSRVGCVLDGAIVYYEDGHETPCGPRTNSHNGGKHYFGQSTRSCLSKILTDIQTGGHASERFSIPKDDEIVKVEVGVESYELNGLRFHMSGGTAGGYLYEETPAQTLGTCFNPKFLCRGFKLIQTEPSPGHKIIGFYGWSRWGQSFNEIMEFGIITAPRDVELPETIYDMSELRNTNGGNAAVSST